MSVDKLKIPDKELTRTLSVKSDKKSRMDDQNRSVRQGTDKKELHWRIKVQSWHHKQLAFEEKKVRLFMEHIQDIDVDDMNECPMKEFLKKLERPRHHHHHHEEQSELERLDNEDDQSSARPVSGRWVENPEQQKPQATPDKVGEEDPKHPAGVSASGKPSS